MDKKLIEYVMGEAAKSNIEKRQVGAIIVAHHQDGSWDIVGRGYNTEGIHAEGMACEELFNSEYVKPESSKLTCYVSHPPCPNCATLLAEHGVSNTEVIEAFMKFDGDKTRYDLLDPHFVMALTHLDNGTARTVADTNRMLYALRQWQIEPKSTDFLLCELLAFYGNDRHKLEEHTAEVLTFGARKYKPNNWRKCSDTGRYLAAAIRHGKAILQGEDTDEESGLMHAAHLATNVMYLFCLGYQNDY